MGSKVALFFIIIVVAALRHGATRGTLMLVASKRGWGHSEGRRVMYASSHVQH